MSDTAPAAGFDLRRQLLLGMTWRAYARSLLTPVNALAAVICGVGLAVVVWRFRAGLGATTNLTQAYPWGLWVGFDMLTGIALAAGGFTIGATIQFFGLEEYHAVERSAILAAWLGYMLEMTGVIIDLGRPWNIYQVFLHFGTTSMLFEVTWCVLCYTSVLTLEFSLPFFQWLGWKRAYAMMRKALLALTVLAVVFSTMHQSALGSLFLLTPGKLHPLWYSRFIFVFFLASSVVAGIGMIIVVYALSCRFFPKHLGGPRDSSKLVLGMGKAGALVGFAYFVLKVQGVVDGHAWDLLRTRWGLWFLVEVLGFVLAPVLLYAEGVRRRRAVLVQVAAGWALAGVVLNRLNVSVIAFNWRDPTPYVPRWTELMVSLTLVTVGVLAYRWIVNRMAILGERPALGPASQGD